MLEYPLFLCFLCFRVKNACFSPIMHIYVQNFEYLCSTECCEAANARKKRNSLHSLKRSIVAKC